MASTIFTSSPTLAKASIRVLRKWQSLPEAASDDDLLAQGLISPEMIELIMQIITSLMNNCMDNNTKMAMKRIKAHLDGKAMDRLANNMRLNGLVDKWLYTMGIPRERGDVVVVRESLVLAAGSLTEQELSNIQTEVFSWSMI
jgi:hypothetical protein